MKKKCLVFKFVNRFDNNVDPKNVLKERIFLDQTGNFLIFKTICVSHDYLHSGFRLKSLCTHKLYLLILLEHLLTLARHTPHPL